MFILGSPGNGCFIYLVAAAILPWLPEIMITDFAKIGKANVARTFLHLLRLFWLSHLASTDGIIIDITSQA